MNVQNSFEIPVSVEFEKFNEEFSNSLRSKSHLISGAIDHIMSSEGKHVRPLLLLLSAKVCGEVTSMAINAAVLLELLHTATLIHDDVIDETKQRRGVPSLNAIFDNRVSVLVGDYFLSAALMRAISTNNFRIIGIVSNLGKDLSEGEIYQMETADDVVLDEARYTEVIRKKTAVLLSACSEIGAISASASDEIVEKFRLFGEYLGYCFQIRDDIFDYFQNPNVGKPTGNDIREGKITLPLLYALRNNPNATEMLDIIRRKEFTDVNVESLLSFAIRNGGIDYAYSKMEDYKNKAVEQLRDIPKSESLDALLSLADYIVSRSK